MDTAPSPAIGFGAPDATVGRDAFVEHRWTIWRASAPLFERHGFAGIVFDQLAMASGLAPLAIYRFFPNKQAVALFPLSHASGLGREWDARVASLPMDPEVRLEAMRAFAAEHADAWRVAMAMATEIAATPGLDRFASRMLKEGREMFAAIVRSIDPGMTASRFAELYDLLRSSFAADSAPVEENVAVVSVERGPRPAADAGTTLTTTWPLRRSLSY